MKSKSSVDQFKLAAIRLQKTIKQLSIQPRQVDTQSAECLQDILPDFHVLSPAELRQQLARITLAQCCLAIARKNGYDSWEALLLAFAPNIDQLSDEDLICVKECSDPFLNVWFATYDEAKAYQKLQKKRFLFPYKNTYFVCTATYIENLGVDSLDEDWERIGFDWEQPGDNEAKIRLRAKLRQARATQLKMNKL